MEAPINHEDPRPTELISGDGGFNEAGLNDFINSVNLHSRGLSYAVVAIMGPQSGGKSTLLNHLFHTNFKMMDHNNGRSKTTKGIWIAKALDMEPFTMVVDLEGTDGRQRSDEDDTAFEKQSALFVLVVADIILINIWCHDIGREQAANRPLLKIIFEVMTRKFNPRKTTLFFVIRDKTKSPFEALKTDLMNDIQKIWEIIPKSQGTPLSDFFNVEVIALSNYEEKEEQFKEEVAQLRNRFFDSISPGGIAGDRQRVVPASGFCLSAMKIWETIKQDKDLDLPAHKIMVATTRCEQIAKEKLDLFASNEEWLAVQAAAEIGVVSGFGAEISSILSRYLSEYDSESLHFEENVRNEKRQYLESEAVRLVHPAYIKTLGHLRSEQFQSFKTQLETHLCERRGYAVSVHNCQQSCELEFDRRCSDAAVEQAGWECDASTLRDQLLRDIENHTLLVRAEKLPKVVDQCQKRLSRNLAEQLRQIFTSHEEEITWGAVRRALRRECDAAASDLSSAVDGFELDQTIVEQKVNDIKQHARQLVENKFKEETRDVLGLMKRTFTLSFQETYSAPTANAAEEVSIRAAEEAAYRKCLKILSIMAVMRLDEGDDNVESVLLSALLAADAGVQLSHDPLASSTWEQIRPDVTLITPVQCKDIWEQFKRDMELILPQVRSIEETCRAEKRWLPPTWVIVGVLALGFTGLMLFLRVWNLDVLLAVISAAGKGIQLLGVGIAIYRNARELFEQDIDFDRFRKTHRRLMRNLRRLLRRFHEFIMTLSARGSVVEVGA